MSSNFASMHLQLGCWRKILTATCCTSKNSNRKLCHCIKALPNILGKTSHAIFEDTGRMLPIIINHSYDMHCTIDDNTVSIHSPQWIYGTSERKNAYPGLKQHEVAIQNCKPKGNRKPQTEGSLQQKQVHSKAFECQTKQRFLIFPSRSNKKKNQSKCLHQNADKSF